VTVLTFMDIVHANLDALTYQRVEKAISVSARARSQSLANLCAIHAYRAHTTVEEFKSPARIRDVSWPRQDFMLAAHRKGYSLSEIGRFLNRDHTTVLHGIRQAEAREAPV
jgi:chromosomal replication initiation ATPase DnaA